MINIEDYILKSLEERQLHLRMDEPCIERGGNSIMFRGLIAHFHDTTIPKGYKIDACHACHNAKCSNPNHLYWGTRSENRKDYIANGGFTNPWEASVAKYGMEEACQRQGRGFKAAAGGRGNKGKCKSEEHKRKISEALRKKN